MESPANGAEFVFTVASSGLCYEPCVLRRSHDALTTVPNADFSNEGGIPIYSADVTQLDLFGAGAAIKVRSHRGAVWSISPTQAF